MVIKVDDLTTQNQLGNASREPRWAIAWKFPPEGAVTTLLDIEISHGRFGRLTRWQSYQPYSSMASPSAAHPCTTRRTSTARTSASAIK